MKINIGLNKQIFGGHKAAIWLEMDLPVQLGRAISMELKSLNLGSQNNRYEKMVRAIKIDKDFDLDSDQDVIPAYIIKEKTKIHFNLNRKDVVVY